MTYLCDPAGRNRPSCDAYIGVCTTTLLDCCGESRIRTHGPVTVYSFQDCRDRPTLPSLQCFFKDTKLNIQIKRYL